ncbi:hypothetical protein KFE98_10220 [bacterium SCSIO 12741]|nr:hypothetical protein KFE98_10220 [bacterium SCSIO 12741]
MKKNTIKTLSLVALVSVGLAACNPLKKMDKYAENIKYSVNPDPLEMHGDSVEVNISGKIPPKYFHKLATVKAKAVLKNADGEVVKELKEMTLLGNEADGDGKKIDYEKGGSFSYTDKIAYEPIMENVQLFVQATGSFKTKTQEFESRKIGDGTITTPYLVQSDARPILAKDNFKKVIPHTVEAQIHYLIQSSQVRSTELRDEDIKAFTEFVEMAVANEYVFKGVTVSAYASPDGEMDLNDNLANNRAKTAAQAIMRILKRKKVEAAKAEGFITEIGKGEDWEGFEKATKASDIEDKDIILGVLKMNADNAKREAEIKNMAAVYVELAEKVLPSLRRSMITLNADEMARTDEEITALTKSNPDTLSVEELLYAATLTNDLDEKLRIYKLAQSQYPSDWRAHNNVGYVMVLQNNVSGAKAEFEKAASAQNTPIVSNNLGVCELFEGNTAKAEGLFKSASGAGPEVSYNMGIINIKKGDYGTAVSKFGGEKTFNAALAQMLNGNNDGALKTLDASEAKATAEGYYLKAVIGARTSNNDMVTSNLKSAFGLEGKLKSKAANDAEFISLREDAAFSGLVK